MRQLDDNTIPAGPLRAPMLKALADLDQTLNQMKTGTRIEKRVRGFLAMKTQIRSAFKRLDQIVENRPVHVDIEAVYSRAVRLAKEAVNLPVQPLTTADLAQLQTMINDEMASGWPTPYLKTLLRLQSDAR